MVPREVVESGYEAPEINYAEPEEQTYEIPKEAYEHPQEPTAYSPPVTYSPVQYNDQFSKPPYVAPSNTDVKYHAYPSASGNAASKPPVSELVFIWVITAMVKTIHGLLWKLTLDENLWKQAICI